MYIGEMERDGFIRHDISGFVPEHMMEDHGSTTTRLVLMKTDGRFVKNVVYFRSILNELIRVFGLNHRLNVKIMKLKWFIILVKIKIFD